MAYYGQQGDRGESEYARALDRWDGDDSWRLGEEIQIQISKSKRLLGSDEQRQLHRAQQEVVDELDRTVDDLRQAGTQGDWRRFYELLMDEKRADIDRILSGVAERLAPTRGLHRGFTRSEALTISSPAD